MNKKASVVQYNHNFDVCEETMDVEKEKNIMPLDAHGVEEYIIDMLKELHSLAEKANLHLIALLLKLVCDAAQSNNRQVTSR